MRDNLEMEPAQVLRRYLDQARSALAWKLAGLTEVDIRRPMTPTGTNLLGLVKHAASVELGYLGDCFNRPSGIALSFEDDDPDADLWAKPTQTRADIIELADTARKHSAMTLAEIPLDTLGEVPWWPPERRHPSLYWVTVHLISDLQRHAGQADIIREQLDGAIGLLPERMNLSGEGESHWSRHYDEVAAAAASFK